MTKCRIISLTVIFAIVAALPLAASAWEQSRLKMDYGTSYKLAKFGQIADPGAEKNLAPVTGLDGQAAESALAKYRKGFGPEISKPAGSMSSGGYGTLMPVLPIIPEGMPMGVTAR